MNNIKTARCQVNMTQQQAANALGIDRVTYARYESGLRVPSVQTLISIAHLFHSSMDYLVGNEQPVIACPQIQAITEEQQELIRLWRSSDKTYRSVALKMLKDNPASYEERETS